MKYVDKYHPYIKDCLKKYPSIKLKFRKIKEKIVINPFGYGEPLKHNLSGLRSCLFSKNFILIYIICEECIKNKYQFLSKCGSRSELIPNNSIIFLCFGPHDLVYKKTAPKLVKTEQISDDEYNPFTVIE